MTFFIDFVVGSQLLVTFCIDFAARVTELGPGSKKDGKRRRLVKRNSPLLETFFDVFSERNRGCFAMPSTRPPWPILRGFGASFGSLWVTFFSTNRKIDNFAGQGSGCSENPRHEVLGGHF